MATLAWTFAIYLPALGAIFQFDDFPNLSGLDRINSDPTLDEIAQFVLHGISSPTGRPISLLTFALQAGDWPGNPAGFLRVNLLLHLLNGLLLFWCLTRLLRLMPERPAAAAFVPWLATALWLVAPIQATAVVYVVQRMAELSATFVFLGLLLYLIGRQRLLSGALRMGFMLMSGGLFVGTVLGVLAKENAALFPLLVLVTEATLLARTPRPPIWRPWAMLFLGLPTLAILGYLLYRAVGYDSTYEIRNFSLGERLLTESRVLCMYLYKLLLPWPSAVRLLYDDYPVSSSLLQPWTTLPAVAAVTALIASGWQLRRRYPVYSFGVLWFFAAHALESSVVPLELVFEHRNYQASAGPLFALAVAIPAVWRLASHRLVRNLVVAFVGLYLLLLSSVTWQIATLWGNPMLMADWWSQTQPDSKRAKIEFLSTLMAYGVHDHAIDIARQASEHWPDDPSFYLVQLHMRCDNPEVDAPVDEIRRRLGLVRTDIYTVIHLIDTVTTQIERGRCAHLDPAVIGQLTEAALGNPVLATQRRNLLLVRARSLKLAGRLEESLDVFREAVDMHPLVVLLLQGFLDELHAGRHERAEAYLRMAESDPRVSPVDRWTYRKDIEAIRRLWEIHAPAQ